GAVILGAGDAPRVVLAGDEAPLAVAGVAVGIVRRLAEDRDCPGFLVPAHDAVVRDVAPQHAARIAEPDRPLAPAHAGREPLDAREREAIFGEARIEDLHRRVGIALARGPGVRHLFNLLPLCSPHSRSKNGVASLTYGVATCGNGGPGCRRCAPHPG